MAYTVPDVPLIAQDKAMACWYASAQMVVRWRRQATRSTELGRPDPSQLPTEVARYKADNGLTLDQMVTFAERLGFRCVPPLTPTTQALEAWLRSYGPIWTAGRKQARGLDYGHVVVIVGVSRDTLTIHDPEVYRDGGVRVVPLSWLATTLSLAPHVIPTNFMHY